MAQINAREFVRPGVPPAKEVGHIVNGRVRSVRASVLLSAQAAIAIGDTIYIGKRPKGSRYAGHRITSGASLGTATLALGAEGAATKYRDAATFTAVDTPTVVGKAAQLAADPLADDERMIATVGAAALPTTAGVYLVIETYYTYD